MPAFNCAVEALVQGQATGHEDMLDDIFCMNLPGQDQCSATVYAEPHAGGVAVGIRDWLGAPCMRITELALEFGAGSNHRERMDMLARQACHDMLGT